MVVSGLRMLIICWLSQMTAPSRLIAFGWIRFQPKSLFLLGKPHEGRFSL